MPSALVKGIPRAEFLAQIARLGAAKRTKTGREKVALNAAKARKVKREKNRKQPIQWKPAQNAVSHLDWA